MIPEFVQRFDASRNALADRFRSERPSEYSAIVKMVVEALASNADRHEPDPERIHEIDDGDYQGTLVYIIGAKGYQPSDYWSVFVSYGSCSGCDTLQSVLYDNTDGSDEQVAEYMMLALHIVQGMKKMESDGCL